MPTLVELVTTSALENNVDQQELIWAMKQKALVIYLLTHTNGHISVFFNFELFLVQYHKPFASGSH